MVKKEKKLKLKKTKIRLIAVASVLLMLSGCSAANSPVQLSTAEPNYPPAVSDGQQSPTGGQTSASAQPSMPSAVAYENTDYGFTFNLPADWEGNSIIDGEWEGLATGGESGEKVVDTGPMISIRDPSWKTETPRQDIPIMIFTLDQWEALQNGDYHIGAASVGPSDLAATTYTS